MLLPISPSVEAEVGYLALKLPRGDSFDGVGMEWACPIITTSRP